jgi:hypothetical protein
MPGPDGAFAVFIKNLILYVVDKCNGVRPPMWTHIPPEARTDLDTAYTAWDTAYQITLKPCTPPETAEKNRVRKVTEKILRNFINIYLRFHPAVTEEDKRNMGLHIPDTTRTTIEPPGTGPIFGIAQIGPRTLGIVYRRGLGARPGSKPPWVKGARIHYGVFDTPPTHQRELPASVWATRCPHIIPFRETDRGKRAYFSLKWETGKGGESPWSEIESEIIP